MLSLQCCSRLWNMLVSRISYGNAFFGGWCWCYTEAVGCRYAKPNVLMLYLAVDAVATSVADCGCGEPHVLMLYRTVDVVATAAINYGYAEHAFDNCVPLDDVAILEQLTVGKRNPMFWCCIGLLMLLILQQMPVDMQNIRWMTVLLLMLSILQQLTEGVRNPMFGCCIGLLMLLLYCSNCLWICRTYFWWLSYSWCCRCMYFRSWLWVCWTPRLDVAPYVNVVAASAADLLMLRTYILNSEVGIDTCE